MRPREARVPGLFVRATVCTRDNTHASAQKIQLYVWRLRDTGFYVGARRFTAFGGLGKSEFRDVSFTRRTVSSFAGLIP